MTQKIDLNYMQEVAGEYGGKCLSKKYINQHTPLDWMCANGHTFEGEYFLINRGLWCPRCAKEEGREHHHINNVKHTIEEMCEVARSRGGKCISAKYVAAHAKLKWCCDKGHTWAASPSQILQGRWCPICRYDRVSEKLRGDINEIRRIAESNGGKLLSTEYINRNEPLQFECASGHRWTANASNLKFGKTWCPVCAHRVKLTLGEMKAIAKSRKGKCLSPIYVDGKTKLDWQCEKGHTWSAIPILIKRGSWCPVCANSKRGQTNKLSISIYKAIAKKHGGKLLSGTYINAHTHLKWQCQNGHEWMAQPAKIKNSGNWCPYCAGKRKLKTPHLSQVFQSPGA